jgi:hypothetical protein
MNFFKRKSDSEVVEELRRAQRWRRPMGLFFIAFGLFLVALHVWGQAWVRRKVLEIADMADDARGGAPRDICHSSALLAYAEGFHSGFSLAFGGALGALLLGSGIRSCFGGRKERLLLQHFDGGGQVQEDQPTR